MSEVAVIDRHFPIIPPQQTREMHMLAAAFNQMVKHLEASFFLQENFVADVSHELRTPLTFLRGQLDVLLLETQQDAEVQQDLYRVRQR